MASFRAIALIAARNEADIISQVLEHLIREGLEIYLVDDASTDETVAEASRWLGRGLLHIEARAEAPHFDWTALLKRKEELASQLDADWFIHHDADEFRESPWPDRTLAEAIRSVDALSYNAIDFRVLNFPPTHDEYGRGMDVREAFRHFEPAPPWDRFQIKAWKRGSTKVDLVSSGGHEVVFADRRVCPIQFLCRHYPIRGQAHGQTKVIHERKARFSQTEVDRGWHVQYTNVNHDSVFIRDRHELQEYDPAAVRAELLTSGREGYLRRLEEQVGERLRRELAEQKATAERALAELQERRDEISRVQQNAAQWHQLLEEERAESATARADAEARQQSAEQCIRNLEDRVQSLMTEVNSLYGSKSWRMTRPLRRAYELINPSAPRNPADRDRSDEER